MTAWRIHTATLFYSLLSAINGLDLFLDVGSLDGRESFAVEARFPDITCLAFEPNPRNIRLIKEEIIRRNSQVELRTNAIGNSNGTTTFYTRIPVGSHNYGASSMLKFAEETRDEEFSTSTLEVPLCRLDSMKELDSYHKIALWIDVEGAGYQVLEGMKGIVPKVQAIHMEVETRSQFENGKLAADIIKIMRDYNFDLIGSNLDRNFQRHQGDLVFLRRHSISNLAIKKAVFNATIVESLAIQPIAQRVLPPKVYRAGRDWLVHHVSAR